MNSPPDRLLSEVYAETIQRLLDLEGEAITARARWIADHYARLEQRANPKKDETK